MENSCGDLAGIDYISHEERSVYKYGYVVGFFSGWLALGLENGWTD
jgi:hypothetical protein